MCGLSVYAPHLTFRYSLTTLAYTRLQMSFNPEKFKIVELPVHTIISGMLPVEVNKNNVKDLIHAVIKQGGFASYQEMDEEGDIILEEKKMPLEGLVGFTIEQNGQFIQFLKNTRPADASDDEPSAVALVNCVTIGEWVFGKQERKIGEASVGSTDYVVLHLPLIKQLEVNADNYIAANLDWLIDSLIDDFGDKFPDADAEEIDDGE